MSIVLKRILKKKKLPKELILLSDVYAAFSAAFISVWILVTCLKTSQRLTNLLREPSRPLYRVWLSATKRVNLVAVAMMLFSKSHKAFTDNQEIALSN